MRDGGAVDPFVFQLSIFVLAVFVGYFVVWSVTPALHTPLDVGDQRDLLGDRGGRAPGRPASRSSRGCGRCGARARFVALVFASINIFGGFWSPSACCHVSEEEIGAALP